MNRLQQQSTERALDELRYRGLEREARVRGIKQQRIARWAIVGVVCWTIIAWGILAVWQ